MEINQSVLYTENGEEFVATVLEIRELDHHYGKNREPLLHLGYFKPVIKANTAGVLTRKSVVGTHDQNDLVQFRLDVAHESHRFGIAARKAGLSGIYPGGRWKHIEIKVVEPVAEQPAQLAKVTKKNEPVQ